MITQQEFEAILSDSSKQINGDISWREDEDKSVAREFRVEIESDSAYPISVLGWINPMSGKLSYALIHHAAGRIYALDLGADHRNPTGEHVGRKHKHRWTEEYRDKMAYVPDDITAPWNQPIGVWRQFCTEANILHQGKLHRPFWRR